MSARNGDRARFQKNRKRKLLQRQRTQAFLAGLGKKADEAASTRVAGLAMNNEGGPPRAGE